MLAKIFSCIIVALLIGLFGCLLVYWAIEDWWDYRKSINFRLTFDHFKQLYSIAPRKYTLHPGYVSYGGNLIGFSLLDWRKYRKWKKKQKQKAEELKTIREKKEFLESVNRDIDAYKINSRKEIEELSAKVASGELPQLDDGAGSVICKRAQNGGRQ